ncbi:MAG: 4-hydroxy-3-methylbut-2-enyl diphosphate reductase, partial [Myxococcaceae bacterium]|nr:4-hydroxy-3-methylbut-2-enyl diphosphate reductase [Myxococcaceae bacterium]
MNPTPFLALLVLLTSGATGSPHSGTWTAEVRKDALQLQLRFQRNSNMGHPFPLSSFQGLTSTEDGAAPFRLEREAGTFHFEGRFRDGEGAGHFRFEPSEAYARAMAELGYRRLTENQHLQLAFADLTTRWVKELAELGYRNLPVDDLMQAAIFQVTPGYVREMAALGYGKLSFEELVQSRIHGVTPERIRALAAAGYEKLKFDTLLSMSIHGVTPEFIREVRELGFRDIEREQLVTFRIHGVTPAFIREMR